MIGQTKFKNKIDALALVPHSIIIRGDIGSEFLEASKYIASKIGAEFMELDVSKINEINASTVKILYAADMGALTEKDQNAMLKLFEEPSQYAYIVLYGSSLETTLETIVNRSYIVSMDKYSKDELSGILRDATNADVAITPGLVEIVNHTDMPALRKLCSNMVTSIGSANLANALSITNRINFSDEYDKFDVNVFFMTLCSALVNTNALELYKIANHNFSYINFMNDKKKYFDNMILKMWEVSRGHSRT